MAFVNRSERKLGPHNLQTADEVGPGSYVDGTKQIQNTL